MLPTAPSGSPTETNHAATGSKCADEGLSGPLNVGQVWAYFTDNPLYGEDAEGEFLAGTESRLLEFYSLVSRVSYKIARKPLGLGPKAARNYEYWEWLVFTFDARLGITPEQLKTGSRVFMNENAFISPMSVFDLELIA